MDIHAGDKLGYPPPEPLVITHSHTLAQTVKTTYLSSQEQDCNILGYCICTP